MRRTVVIVIASVGLAAVLVVGLGVLAAGAIDAGALGVGVEQAQAQSVKRSGDRAADLVSEIVGPLMLVLVGVFACVALAKREIGIALTAAVIGLIAGLFVFAPQTAQDVFEGTYKTVF